MELEMAVAAFAVARRRAGQPLGCEWSFTEGANGRKPVLRVCPKKK